MEALRLHNYTSARLDDATIVKRIIAGEKELFEILLRRYNQTLYRVIRSYLKEAEEVRDAMQNAYLKAFDKLYQFQGTSGFSTWLIRIGINEALLRLREIRKEKTLYSNVVDSTSPEIKQIADQQMNPEAQIISRETARLLERAIDNLPEKYRLLYILKEVEGFQNNQIAECLGITDENVKVRFHRAKNLLRDGLYKMSSAVPIFEFGNDRCDEIVNFVMKSI